MYRAVGNRCAISIADFSSLLISRKEALDLLARLGFRSIEIDVAALARQLVGSSIYHVLARHEEAPDRVNCWTLTKWLYAQRGIWLPRWPVQQREVGAFVDLSSVQAGDLLFRSGQHDCFVLDPHDAVGHVGLLTEKKTVIHAAGTRKGVVEESLNSYLAGGSFRGARRYVESETITWEIPSRWQIESSDDLLWTIRYFTQRPERLRSRR